MHFAPLRGAFPSRLMTVSGGRRFLGGLACPAHIRRIEALSRPVPRCESNRDRAGVRLGGKRCTSVTPAKTCGTSIRPPPPLPVSDLGHEAQVGKEMHAKRPRGDRNILTATSSSRPWVSLCDWPTQDGWEDANVSRVAARMHEALKQACDLARPNHRVSVPNAGSSDYRHSTALGFNVAHRRRAGPLATSRSMVSLKKGMRHVPSHATCGFSREANPTATRRSGPAARWLR